MFPLALLLPFLRANWKPIAAGLAVVAVSCMMVGGCRHYRKLVAANAVLKIQNAAEAQALSKWKAAEAERTRREAEAARAAQKARSQTRELNEAFSETKTPDELVARHDVAHLFGLLSEATALDP